MTGYHPSLKNLHWFLVNSKYRHADRLPFAAHELLFKSGALNKVSFVGHDRNSHNLIIDLTGFNKGRQRIQVKLESHFQVACRVSMEVCRAIYSPDVSRPFILNDILHIEHLFLLSSVTIFSRGWVEINNHMKKGILCFINVHLFK